MGDETYERGVADYNRSMIRDPDQYRRIASSQLGTPSGKTMAAAGGSHQLFVIWGIDRLRL
eukprot:805316-Amphidinium_carterae.1